MKILGFDPGTARLGFGMVEKNGSQMIAGDFGVIETKSGEEKAQRLLQIKQDLEELLDEYKPDLVGVEELFFVKNVKTGITVAEARGVILATVAERGIRIIEIKPVEVKNCICGNGQAEKMQVQRMVQTLLKLEEVPHPDDAADALAVAITCSQMNYGLK